MKNTTIKASNVQYPRHSVHCQILRLIASHETFNLMLCKDASELTDLCFKHNNV